jgi:hypothetical protein
MRSAERTNCLKAAILLPTWCALDAVHGLLSGRCGDSTTEREFPSDKVYRRDDRGIVGVGSISLQGLAFVVIHTSVGREPRSDASSWPSPMMAEDESEKK